MQTASPALMAVSSMTMDVSDLAATPMGVVSNVGLTAGNQAEDLLEVATGSGHGGMAMGALCLAILGAAGPAAAPATGTGSTSGVVAAPT